jgi:hypothetical protein
VLAPIIVRHCEISKPTHRHDLLILMRCFGDCKAMQKVDSRECRRHAGDGSSSAMALAMSADTIVIRRGATQSPSHHSHPCSGMFAFLGQRPAPPHPRLQGVLLNLDSFCGIDVRQVPALVAHHCDSWDGGRCTAITVERTAERKG